MLCEISQFLYVATDICMSCYMGQTKYICGLDPAHGLWCLTYVTTVMVFNPYAVNRKQDQHILQGVNYTVAW